MIRSLAILAISFLTNFTPSYGQEHLKIDTIKYFVFDAVMHYTVQGKDTTCGIVNGKSFPVKEYLRIEKINCRLEGECRDSSEHLFYVNTYNIHGQLLYSAYQTGPEDLFFGAYREYYTNGKIKAEGQYLFFGNNWEEYNDENNWNKKTGVWKYYNKNGKLKRTENF